MKINGDYRRAGALALIGLEIVGDGSGACDGGAGALRRMNSWETAYDYCRGA